MAKFINGKVYLSPQEASAILGVSYKTLQRWVECGGINRWTQTKPRRRKWKRIKIDRIVTPTGYRLYEQVSIEKLRDSFN